MSGEGDNKPDNDPGNAEKVELTKNDDGYLVDGDGNRYFTREDKEQAAASASMSAKTAAEAEADKRVAEARSAVLGEIGVESVEAAKDALTAASKTKDPKATDQDYAALQKQVLQMQEERKQEKIDARKQETVTALTQEAAALGWTREQQRAGLSLVEIGYKDDGSLAKVSVGGELIGTLVGEGELAVAVPNLPGAIKKVGDILGFSKQGKQGAGGLNPGTGDKGKDGEGEGDKPKLALDSDRKHDPVFWHTLTQEAAKRNVAITEVTEKEVIAAIK